MSDYLSIWDIAISVLASIMGIYGLYLHGTKEQLYRFLEVSKIIESLEKRIDKLETQKDKENE